MTTRLRSQALAGALAALSVLAMPGQAAAQIPNPWCDDLPTPVFVSGSTAVAPLLAILGSALAQQDPPITIVYVSGGSCIGVTNALTGEPLRSTGTYWVPGEQGAPPVQLKCEQKAEGSPTVIGVSDVFGTSCPGVTQDDLTAAKIGDFWGPNQVMTFIVPQTAGAEVTNISAEAAYLVFGKTEKSILPWTTRATLFARNESSGTQTMLGLAIRLPAGKWDSVDSGSNAEVIKGISGGNGAGMPGQYLGISSTSDSDAHRETVKVLGFQDFGKSCAVWPDSSLTSFDKINVRTGEYPVFGPLHLLTKVDDAGTPVDANARRIIDYVTGAVKLATNPTAMLKVQIDAYTVPQCAMKVKRTADMGPLSAYSPAEPCGCFFDKNVPGGDTDCKECTETSECAATEICSYGYCEAKP